MSIIGIETQQDLILLRKIYKNSVALGESGREDTWDVKYSREFDMTTDRKKFKTLEEVIKNRGKETHFGHWSLGDELLVPFYTGRIINQFDYSSQAWIEGHGNNSSWKPVDFTEKYWRPEYLMPVTNANPWRGGIRLVFRDLSNPHNERTMIATAVPAWPCGNKLPLLYDMSTSVTRTLTLLGVLNSLVYDYVVRIRLMAINLNKFIVYETPVPIPSQLPRIVPIIVARLAMCHEVFAKAWLELASDFPELRLRPWKSWWAVDQAERTRLRAILDAIIADSYGIDSENNRDLEREYSDLEWILSMDDQRPRGFWRVDQSLPEPIRLPVLTLEAFHALKAFGIEALVADQSISGWQLPKSAQSHFNETIPVNLEEQEASWGACELMAERIHHLWPQLDVQTNPSVKKPTHLAKSLFEENELV